ncbi:alpha/beta hydrolase [Mycolicibacterium sp. P9-64]|uniref:alpha/beta hydrolase n=1 Tax=Mycolicibacterium sp. P9-64 TaxID=2024612 RepID=UPI0011ED078F|nr:alpha/beta hydrolase [Mycolicibacterium sp. P9-64]KAA0074926.1 alpha/beta hydrolase [Mycolicibacterium sp. P9-64]
MEQLSVWLGAGLVTAGVSAALIAGAGLASADPGSDSGSSGASSSKTAPSRAGAGASDSAGDKGEKKDPAKPSSATKPDSDKPDSETDKGDDGKPSTDAPSTSGVDEDGPGANDVSDDVSDDEATSGATSGAANKTKKKSAAATEASADAAASSAKPEPEPEPKPAPEPAAASATPAAKVTDTSEIAPVESVANHVAAQAVSNESASSPSLAQTQLAPGVPPQMPSAVDVVSSLIGAVVANVGSFVFNALQAVEAFVTGPPLVPPNSTVTVRSSTILLSNGQRVAANWFFPDGDEPPTNMILLQHGFFALGPMYSYTAANLAEQTHSIVVTPTLSSNPFAGDSNWLGGTGMSAAIADLFVGDRAALTASALDAGFATKYGLDPGTAALPRQFALAGHSLGANLVSGAAGFLTENGGAADLAGVILLDGVPLGDTLAHTLALLDAYEATTGKYIPVREIGAPPNLFNAPSNVNAALSTARPDRFNGVVLTGGVHMDSMRGGNPLIQFVAYVVAGFPQPQNPPAVEELATSWLRDWFNGVTDAGDDLIPGTILSIPTPQGTAQGVVIGNPPAVTLLRGPVTVEASVPSAIPAIEPRLAALAA